VHFFTLLLGVAAVATIFTAVPVAKSGCTWVRKKLAHCGHWMARRRYHGRHAKPRHPSR
jgi:hypothetical protein